MTIARMQGTAKCRPGPNPPGSLLLDRWSFFGRRNSLGVHHHHHRSYRLHGRRRLRRSARRGRLFCSGSGSCFPLQGLPLQAGLLLHLRLATPHLHRNATIMLSHGRAPSLDRPWASSRKASSTCRARLIAAHFARLRFGQRCVHVPHCAPRAPRPNARLTNRRMQACAIY